MRSARPRTARRHVRRAPRHQARDRPVKEDGDEEAAFPHRPICARRGKHGARRCRSVRTAARRRGLGVLPPRQRRRPGTRQARASDRRRQHRLRVEQRGRERGQGRRGPEPAGDKDQGRGRYQRIPQEEHRRRSRAPTRTAVAGERADPPVHEPVHASHLQGDRDRSAGPVGRRKPGARSAAAAFQLQRGRRERGVDGRHASHQPRDPAARLRRRATGAPARRSLQLQHRLPGARRSHPRHVDPRGSRVHPGGGAGAGALLPAATDAAADFDDNTCTSTAPRAATANCTSRARSGSRRVWSTSPRYPRADSASSRVPGLRRANDAGRFLRHRRWMRTRICCVASATRCSRFRPAPSAIRM